MSEFYKKLYGKYLEPLPDTNAFLERLGLAGTKIGTSKAGLDTVQWAHLTNVPFENIDIYDYDTPVDFGTFELFDKIVTRRRGGYCFELNALFFSLLQALGFETYPVGVRILMGGSEEYLPAISHRASIVIIDGLRYYTDVGFGMTNAPAGGICIDTEEVQTIRTERFFVQTRPDGRKVIMQDQPDGPRSLFTFMPSRFEIPDFVAFNYAMARTGWRAKRIANLRNESGAISIDGDIFRVTSNDTRKEQDASNPEAVMELLTQKFGMTLTKPLRAQAINPDATF